MSSDTDVLVALELCNDPGWVYIDFIIAAQIEFEPADEDEDEDEDLYEDNSPVAFLVIPEALVSCANID